MTDEPARRVAHAAPWRGRKRTDDPRVRFISVRCTPSEHVQITEAASKAGLSVGAFLRALALGMPGPRSVRRPPIERREVARLLGRLGKFDGNWNQIAKAIHTTRNLPSWSELAVIREAVSDMRSALKEVLGRGDSNGH